MERGPGTPERGGTERPRLLLAGPPGPARDARARGLLEAGFEVVCAARGEEALARCRAARPALVLCDPWLEDMEGAALRRRLSEEPSLRSTPFLLLAARPEGGANREGEDAALRELVARIKILLDEEAEAEPDPEAAPAASAAARPVGPPPALDRVFRVDYQVLAARLAELPDTVNGLLRRVDGRRTVEQVLRGVSLARAEALAALGRLAEQGILRPAPPAVRGQPPRVVRFSAPARRPGVSWRTSTAPTPRPEPAPAAPADAEPASAVEVRPAARRPSPDAPAAVQRAPAAPPEPLRVPRAALRWVPILAALLLLGLLGLWRTRTAPRAGAVPAAPAAAPAAPVRR